jgi:hypothetical protein
MGDTFNVHNDTIATFDGDERGNKSRWGGWLKFDGVSVFEEDSRPRDAQFCEVTIKSGAVEVSNGEELTVVSGGWRSCACSNQK